MSKTKKERVGRTLPLRAFVKLAAVVLSAALVCASASALQARYSLQIDLTPTAISRLSEQTIKILEQTDEPVSIHLVFQKATATDLRRTLETLAGQYAARGRDVTVDTIDPVTEPNRIAAFKTGDDAIAEGSAVVANADGSRFKVVNAREMYAYTRTRSGGYALTGVNAEQKLTSAVAYVTSEDMPRIGFLTGHGELSTGDCETLADRLSAENYEVTDYELLKDPALKSGDVLLILSPARDLTEQEAAALQRWLEEDGRLFFAVDATVDMENLPRFAELAGRYSLSFEPGIVVEAETAAGNWMNSPLYLAPDLNRDAAALSGMAADQRVILPGARAVAGPQIPLSGYTYEALLTTSDGAYVKRTDSEAFTREAGDPAGSCQLAVSVERAQEEGKTRAVFIGSLYTAMDSSLLYSTYNLDLMASALSWLSERESGISIPVREIADTSMVIPSAAAAWRILALTLALPAAAAVVGVAVQVRRRRR